MIDFEKRIVLVLIFFLFFPLYALSDETSILNSFEIVGANFAYDIETGNIESKDLITLKSKDFLLSAKGVLFDVKKEEFVGSQGVDLKIGDASIVAKIIKIDFKNRVATLKEDVVASGSYNGKKWGIMSNLINIRFVFTDEKKGIEEIKTDERSKVYYDILSGEADSILYSNIKKNIVLSGNVKVIRDKNTILAEKIIIDLQTKKMITKGKVKIIINKE